MEIIFKLTLNASVSSFNKTDTFFEKYTFDILRGNNGVF